MQLDILDKPSFRISSIEIKRGDAIDQIKIIYDDGQEWCAGHDGGKADKRKVVLTEGEFVVRVTQERFENYKCAGAAVEFVTNKGRVFTYQPRAMCTNRKEEQTTIVAEEGHEIVSLSILKGVLLGSVQQKVPETDLIKHPEQWFVIACNKEKEDDGIIYQHYHSSTEAKAAWKKEILPAVKAKKGRSAVLIDCMRMTSLKQAGDVQALIDAAMAAGYCTVKKEEDVSMLDTLSMLFKLLGAKQSGKQGMSKDFWTFCAVIALLAAASYFDLYASVLTGQVLALFSANMTSTEDRNLLVRGLCAYGTADNCSEECSLQQVMLLSFILVKVVQMASYVANVYLHHNMCDSKNHALRIDAFEHVLKLDQTFFDTHSLSDIRAGMNVHSLNNLISWNIPYLFCRVLKLVLVVYFMACINARLALTACVGMLLVKYGVLEPMHHYERNVHRIQRKLNCMNQQIVDEAFGMVTAIKLFSKEDRHCCEHEQSQRRYMQNISTVVVLRCIREFGYGVLKVATFCTVLYQGLNMLKGAGLGAGDLTSFFLLFQQFQDIFGSIKWHYELLVREFPDIDRFLSLMQAEAAVKDGAGVLPGCSEGGEGAVKGEIGFHGVHFEYPSRPGEKVLKGLSLTMKPNCMTAVVGDSGAGKSTITKLLMRLYDPAQGTVTLDGVDIRTLQLQHLHAKIAIVPQNPDLFNCSIGDNIAYGAQTQPTTEEIHAAAKLANCYDFITKFRGGFDTLAGDRGAQLSAGQKQRIAIARAAVRKPRILVLDEATSSLDAQNEAMVQQALERLMQGCTTIVIAHRLCTIRSADEIVCMREGQVAEKGTHSDLMKIGRGGAYYDLVSKQLEEKEKKDAYELKVPSLVSLQRQTSNSKH